MGSSTRRHLGFCSSTGHWLFQPEVWKLRSFILSSSAPSCSCHHVLSILPHCSLRLLSFLDGLSQHSLPCFPTTLPTLAMFSARRPPHGAFSFLLASAHAVSIPWNALPVPDLTLKRPPQPWTSSVLVLITDNDCLATACPSGSLLCFQRPAQHLSDSIYSC